MTTITILLTFSVLFIIMMGFYLEFKPIHKPNRIPNWIKASVGGNLLLFVLGIAVIMIGSVNEVFAQAEGATAAAELSTGYGLALIGIGLPTGLATIGAGIAVSSVGAASLAVVAEKPEIFGRTLVYLGLAEGIAIYGLVVTILLLGKI
jgi:V/A-type H+-transporting ATPase subunit K